jgi:hypothetical protein
MKIHARISTKATVARTHKESERFICLPVDPDKAANVSITHNRRVNGCLGLPEDSIFPARAKQILNGCLGLQEDSVFPPRARLLLVADSHVQSPTAGDVHVSPTASYYRPGVGAAASGALGRAPPTIMCTGPLNAGGSTSAAGTSAAGTSNGSA